MLEIESTIIKLKKFAIEELKGPSLELFINNNCFTVDEDDNKKIYIYNPFLQWGDIIVFGFVGENQSRLK